MPRQRNQYPKVKKTGGKPNRWCGRWAVYVTENGKQVRKQKYETFGLVKEVKEQDAQAKLDTAVRTATNAPADGEMTLWEFIHKPQTGFIAMREPTWTPKWKKNVKSLYENHFKDSIGRMKLNELNRGNCQAWVNAVPPDATSKSMTHKRRTQLAAMIHEAFVQGIISGNFFQSVREKDTLTEPKTKHKVLRPWLTLAEVGAGFRFTARRKDRKDYIIFRLSICPGIRPSELFALRANDMWEVGLRIDESVVEYVVGEPKTEEANGLVPLTASLRAELEEYIRKNGFADADFLFPYKTGGPMSQNNYVRRQLKTIGKAIGVPALDFRMLRRTFSTHFKKHGDPKDLQSVLRHAGASMAQEVYQQEIPEETANAVNSFDRELLELQAA